MTNIEWTDETWNPIRGCSRISPGCEQCYAERQAIRQSATGEPYHLLVTNNGHGPRWTRRVRFDTTTLQKPGTWGRPRRVFVDSMGDLFHEAAEAAWIWSVYGVMAQTPRHTYQVLTKRAERMAALYAEIEADPLAPPPDAACTTLAVNWGWDGDQCQRPWPLPNVWVGVSVESDDWVSRIHHLRRVPAAVRFVSLEPLLSEPRAILDALQGLDWVIVGGESGPGARPFRIEWAEAIVARCAALGIPCFVKQLGAQAAVDVARLRDATFGPVTTFGDARAGIDRLALRGKGGDPTEWPAHLRVRQWPAEPPRDGAARAPARSRSARPRSRPNEATSLRKGGGGRALAGGE